MTPPRARAPSAVTARYSISTSLRWAHSLKKGSSIQVAGRAMSSTHESAEAGKPHLACAGQARIDSVR